MTVIINNRFELENLKEELYSYIQQWLSKKEIKNIKSKMAGKIVIDSNVAIIGIKVYDYSIDVLIGAKGKKDTLEENKKILEKLVKDLEEKLNSLVEGIELDAFVDYGLEKEIGGKIFG